MVTGNGKFMQKSSRINEKKNCWFFICWYVTLYYYTYHCGRNRTNFRRLTPYSQKEFSYFFHKRRLCILNVEIKLVYISIFCCSTANVDALRQRMKKKTRIYEFTDICVIVYLSSVKAKIYYDFAQYLLFWMVGWLVLLLLL